MYVKGLSISVIRYIWILQKNLWNAWITITALRDSVRHKRTQVQLLRQKLKLSSILRGQVSIKSLTLWLSCFVDLFFFFILFSFPLLFSLFFLLCYFILTFFFIRWFEIHVILSHGNTCLGSQLLRQLENWVTDCNFYLHYWRIFVIYWTYWWKFGKLFWEIKYCIKFKLRNRHHIRKLA